MMKYPKAWPVLDKTNIRTKSAGELRSAHRCLLGWCREVFDNNSNFECFYAPKSATPTEKKFVKHVCDTIVDAIKEELAPQEIHPQASVYTVISMFNDTYTATQVARVWNRTGEMLGYTEIVDVVDGDWRNA